MRKQELVLMVDLPNLSLLALPTAAKDTYGKITDADVQQRMKEAKNKRNEKTEDEWAATAQRREQNVREVLDSPLWEYYARRVREGERRINVPDYGARYATRAWRGLMSEFKTRLHQYREETLGIRPSMDSSSLPQEAPAP